MHDPQYRDPRLGDIDRMLEGSEPDEAGWYDSLRRYLEAAYLAGEYPRAQSGFGGDAEYWERARRPMTRAIEHDGTFLDVRCANGLLMEDVARWAAEVGYHIEPYGLDFSPSIGDLARRRLPNWQDRIYSGNVIDWRPPFGFDYVGVGLESVLSGTLAPGGAVAARVRSAKRPIDYPVVRQRQQASASSTAGW